MSLKCLYDCLLKYMQIIIAAHIFIYGSDGERDIIFTKRVILLDSTDVGM